MPQLNTLK